MTIDYNVVDFIKVVSEKLAKHKELVQKNDFDSISDDEYLCHAVIDLLSDKGDAVLKTLPLNCQFANAISVVINITYSENFEMVYTEYAHLVGLAIVGLYEIKMPELGKVIRQSNFIYEDSKEIIAKLHKEIISLQELSDMQLWQDLHKDFYSIYSVENLLKNMALHIRKNCKDFYNL